jgi:hypothetical protein
MWHISVKVGKPEGKRPLGKPRYKLEESTNVNLKEIGWQSVKWICLIQEWDKWWDLVNIVMNFQVSCWQVHASSYNSNELTN